MEKFWFKRKTYGYGWQPATWQGYVVLLLFFACVVGNIFFRYGFLRELTDEHVKRLVFDTIGMVVILLLICIRTGEKPRWQWGEKNTEETDQNSPR